MFTTKEAKELIAARLNKNGKEDTFWCKEQDDDAFFGDVKVLWMLPHPCGEHHEDVYNGRINVNTICVNHYKEDGCLILDKRYVASRVYLCCGQCEYVDDQDAEQHVGEIYVSFEHLYPEGEKEISLDYEHGFDLSLDEVEQEYPELLKEMVFYLR